MGVWRSRLDPYPGEIERQDAAHVDVLVPDRCETARHIVGMVARGQVDRRLEAMGIPGHDDVREQGQRPRDGAELLGRGPCFAGIMPLWMARCRLWTASPWLSRSRISVRNTGLLRIIAEIEGAQQLSQGVTGFVNGIAGGGRAEAVERLGRRVPAVLDGGSEPEQAHPNPG